tara:strand:- start:79 stop:474 length:396 start_codon:yes stop_codon:yes gene_type:complete
MPSEIFELQIIVPPSAIDEMNHVNNVVYLKWIQDVAKKHWESKIDTTIKESFVWVALNHYLEYSSPAFENDDLILRTWIDNHHGAKSERHTTIINSNSQKILVTAITTWCFISKKTLRPIRITDEVNKLFL